MSEITRKEYWDEFYKMELDNFEDSGEQGEEWFSREVGRLLKWFCSLDDMKSRSASILDLGCGNALFLIRLAGLGFTNLFGCDYSSSAISLALKNCSQFLESISKKRPSALLSSPLPKFELAALDISNPQSRTQASSSSNCPKGVSIVTGEQFVNKKYDVIHDKGTFDVFYMRGDAKIYITALRQFFIHENSILVITSCNATESELKDIFTLADESDGGFLFEVASTLTHRSFTFGGISGQVVSTVAFRTKRL